MRDIMVKIGILTEFKVNRTITVHILKQKEQKVKTLETISLLANTNHAKIAYPKKIKAAMQFTSLVFRSLPERLNITNALLTRQCRDRAFA